MTDHQKRTAEAIVNIFETGSVLGDYGKVTVIPGDTGHLTFGRSQTTLGSGNLAKLLDSYCENPGARFARHFEPWKERLRKADVQLDHEPRLHNLLRATADDPVMRDVQDAFFDTFYWQPALRAAERMGIVTPLGVAVVYDAHVHGSWLTLRDRTTARAGRLGEIGERQWIGEYIRERRAWLANHSRKDLRVTVYRMDVFGTLAEMQLWGLELPLVVRGKEISLATLNAMPEGCYEGPAPGSRALAVQSPLVRGLDVRLLQLALSDIGADIRADGIYGNGSAQCVRDFQTKRGMPVTGVATPEIIGQLVYA